MNATDIMTRMAKGLLTAGLLVLLMACGGGSGNSGGASDSQWDSMQWDQGAWQ